MRLNYAVAHSDAHATKPATMFEHENIIQSNFIIELPAASIIPKKNMCRLHELPHIDHRFRTSLNFLKGRRYRKSKIYFVGELCYSSFISKANCRYMKN